MANRERVIKFNEIAGNAPIGLEDKDQFWEQVISQSKLILEEAQEQYDAALAHDLTEMVDGACDVDYLQTYMDILVQESGVNLGCAKDMVAMNNDQKYTLSEDLAVQSAEAQKAKGVECYVHKTEWRGDTYYLVKRTEDNKVLKLLKHVAPNIRATIPKSTLQILENS